MKLIYSHRGRLCGCSTFSEPTAAESTALLNKHLFQLMSGVQGQFNQAKKICRDLCCGEGGAETIQFHTTVQHTQSKTLSYTRLEAVCAEL